MTDGRTFSRRGFLKTVGAAAAGAGAATLLGGREAGAATAAAEGSAVPIPQRVFGRTGRKVSALGLGTMFDTLENQIVLRRALQLGVTYWDTADCYEHGNSEVGIGKYFAKYPEDREKVFLVSKSDDRDPEGMSKLLAQSLDRLKTDHLDLYLVHGIGAIDEVDRPATRKWAEKAKADGKIKHFGFSTHKNMEDCLLAAAKLSWLDGILFTYNYRFLEDPKMRQAVEACSGAGIALVAMKYRGKGSSSVPEAEADKLWQPLTAKGWTDEQAKMKAVWEDRRIATQLSTMGSVAKLNAGVAAVTDQQPLSPALRDALRHEARATRADWCAGCGARCEPAAEGVPVADVMRFLMYARGYGDLARARSLVGALPADVRARLASADFAAAERACPNRLPIGRLMMEAARELSPDGRHQTSDV